MLPSIINQSSGQRIQYMMTGFKLNIKVSNNLGRSTSTLHEGCSGQQAIMKVAAASRRTCAGFLDSASCTRRQRYALIAQQQTECSFEWPPR